MITGIRSAILCDEVVVHDDGRVDYLGLQGEGLSASSRPGLINVWLALLIELDGKPTEGEVTAQAAGYSQAVPFNTPSGHRLTAAAFPILIPVIDEGELTVTVADVGRGKRLRVKWPVRFAEDAEVLSPEAAEKFIQGAQQSVDIMASAFAAQRKSQH